MTFLNIILLGGLAAGAIPIIIHIINRSRFRVEPWGAMHLLEQMLRTRRRRLRIEQLILLAVRIAIPVLLAFCMARPVLTGMEALLGQAKSSLVILFDNSYSMNAASTTRSHFDQAREETKKIIAALPRNSEATVIWMAGGEGELIGPTFDQNRLQSLLSGSAEGYGKAEVGPGLETTAGLFSEAHYANREFLVISDFQKISWSKEIAQVAARDRGVEQIENLKIPPNLTLFRVGREVPGNVAVDSLELSRPILGVRQKLRIRANIRNLGHSAYPDLRVYFRVDGQDRSVAQISLGPRQSGQVLFSHAFETAGSHVLEVFADADPLKADNFQRFSIPVWDKLPVLLVSGDTNPEPLRSETSFLEIALQPYTSAAADLADLIRTQVTTPEKLNPRDLLERKYRVVVLANVRQLNDIQVKALEDFVREGGGLMVFPGDRVNRDWYNASLTADGRGLLPYQLGELTGSLEDRENPATIVVQHYDHTALELFNDPRNGDLSGSRLYLHYALQPPAVPPEGLLVPARLDTGDPFLVERPYGQGRVVLCCTTCDDEWNNLPLRPFYLPLMQQVVTHLASKVHPPRNVMVGEQLAALLPVTLADKTAILTDPQGRRHELTIQKKENRGVVEYGRTARPGLYVLELPTSEVIHFVVSTSRDESDLTLLDESEFTTLAEQMGAAAVTSSEEYLQLDRRRRFGREIWQTVLWAVLALVFLEVLLQQFFTRAKKA